MLFLSCLCVQLVQVNKDTLTKEALELLRLIPDGYIPLPHQVGGQKHVDGRLGKYLGKGRMGKVEEGCVAAMERLDKNMRIMEVVKELVWCRR